MDICRLKPDYNTCCSCIDTQLDTGEKKDCEDCPEHSWVRLLMLGSTIFGRDYAFVVGPSTDFKTLKVDVKRITDYACVSDENGYHRLNELYRRDQLKKESK